MPRIQRRWKPHSAQKQVTSDDTRFRILAAGRRFGKTRLARAEAFEFAITHPDVYVWWVAPSYEDANELGYDMLMREIPDALVADHRRKFPRNIELVNGSVISFRSADREGGLRGRGLDYVVIDEAGDVPNHSWQEELRPTLSDTMGKMLAIGTPRGRNWFHKWFLRGQDDDTPNTNSWQFSTYDNPYVPDSEIEDARSELPARVFKQEYLAEFAENEGAVFGNVRERNVVAYSWESEPGSPPYTIGIDLGRANDYTAILVVDSTGLVVHVQRMRKTSWARIKSTAEQIADEYGPATIYIDSTRDNAVVESLSDSGYYVEPVRFTAKKKKEIVENLAARLELDEITLPDHDTLLSEMEAFQYETTPSGNVTYNAPSGLHDDMVDALSLAAMKPQTVSATWSSPGERMDDDTDVWG